MRSSRRGQVDPFIVMDVMEAARRAETAGRHIIHMEVGQPGTPAPRGARDALRGALESDGLGYTVALGLPALRSGIARLYRDWYGIELDPERVVVTAGSSGAFLLAFSALFDAGERVGVTEPGYPSYRQILRALSLDPVGVQTAVENRYQPLPDDIRRAGNLAGMIVASPGNPSGTMLDRASLARLIETCAASGTAFISDEIYHGIQYEAPAVSALEISDDVYVINSFSKYFSMTGAGPCAAGGAAGTEHVHLPSSCQPGGGSGCSRVPDGAGRKPCGLYRKPEIAAGGVAEGRVYPDRPTRRCILHLR